MTANPKLAEQLALMTRKATHTLTVARELHSHGHFSDAASRAYYAVFHALQAALLTKGVTVSKHTGLMAEFNRHFIHTGLFPEVAHETIRRLFNDRQTGDYRYGVSIREEQSALDIQEAEQIIVRISQYLSAQNLLPETE
ncbi:MAG TPA: HEPN domain-containing protein [Planctomycetota bacterium]|nr:HEPN domain-containing protein [Planctomycetota bacterium]